MNSINISRLTDALKNVKLHHEPRISSDTTTQRDSHFYKRMMQEVEQEKKADRVEKRKYNQSHIPIEYHQDRMRLKIYIKDLKIKLPTLKKGEPIRLTRKTRIGVCSMVWVSTNFDEFHSNDYMTLTFSRAKDKCKFDSQLVNKSRSIEWNFELYHNPNMYDRKREACHEVSITGSWLDVLCRATIPSEADKNLERDLVRDCHTLKEDDIICHSQSLNKLQKKCILQIMKAENRPHPFVLFGPPGTGKTVTIVEAIIQIHKRNPKANILVCGNSNSCADLIATRLIASQLFEPKGLVRLVADVRLEMASKEMEPYTLNEDGFWKLTRKPRIILATCNKSAVFKRVNDRKFWNFNDDFYSHCPFDLSENDDDYEHYLERTKLQKADRKKTSPEIKSETGSTIDDYESLSSSSSIWEEEEEEKGKDKEKDKEKEKEEEDVDDDDIKTPYRFDFVFIDEAGHAQEAETLIPVVLRKPGGSIVLSGDPHQLSPVCKVQKLSTLTESILDRLFKTSLYEKRANERYDERYIIKLLDCYRSDPRVMSVSNRLFYDSELICCYETPRHLLNILNTSSPMLYDATMGLEERHEMSSYNNAQAMKAVDYVKTLYSGKISPEDVAIITPYRAQVAVISSLFDRLKDSGRDLERCHISTIDEFQGQERQIIIIPTVRTTTDANLLAFFRDYKRFNVAITRARAVVIVIGARKVLELSEHWAFYIERATEISSSYI